MCDCDSSLIRKQAKRNWIECDKLNNNLKNAVRASLSCSSLCSIKSTAMAIRFTNTQSNHLVSSALVSIFFYKENNLSWPLCNAPFNPANGRKPLLAFVCVRHEIVFELQRTARCLICVIIWQQPHRRNRIKKQWQKNGHDLFSIVFHFRLLHTIGSIGSAPKLNAETLDKFYSINRQEKKLFKLFRYRKRRTEPINRARIK